MQTNAGRPLSKFSSTSIEPNFIYFHPIGCPVYVWEAPLQTGAPFQSWMSAPELLFLCHSPWHSSSVPFILNTQSGLILLQFQPLIPSSMMPNSKASGSRKPSYNPKQKPIQWAGHLLILCSRKSFPVFLSTSTNWFLCIYANCGSNPSRVMHLPLAAVQQNWPLFPILQCMQTRAPAHEGVQ